MQGYFKVNPSKLFYPYYQKVRDLVARNCITRHWEVRMFKYQWVESGENLAHELTERAFAEAVTGG
jgi:hypothetical protein